MSAITVTRDFENLATPERNSLGWELIDEIQQFKVAYEAADDRFGNYNVVTPTNGFTNIPATPAAVNFTDGELNQLIDARNFFIALRNKVFTSTKYSSQIVETAV